MLNLNSIANSKPPEPQQVNAAAERAKQQRELDEQRRQQATDSASISAEGREKLRAEEAQQQAARDAARLEESQEG
jgi:hypothetical protein